MLTLARTHAQIAKPERETVARYAVSAYPFAVDEIGRDEFTDDCELVTDDTTELSTNLLSSPNIDWKTLPTEWTNDAALYYLQVICGEHVPADATRGSGTITAENLSRTMTQFRQRNTETACAVVTRVELLNAVKNAKKLNPRSPAKTVSLRINGCLDVVTSDHTARFSQAVRYDSKAGDLRLTFPEQRLTAICTKLKSKTVELVLTSCAALNEHVLTVKTDSAEFTIPVEIPTDGERFVSDFPATFAHNVKAGELLRAFKMTEFATDTESSRYALAGCFLQPGDDTLDIAATDYRRLSVETIPAEVLGAMPAIERGESRHPLGVVVPPGIVALLIDELKRQPESAVVSFAVAQPIYRTQILFPPANLSPAKQATWKPEPLANTEANANSVQFQDDNGAWLLGFTRTEFVFELSGAFSIRGIPQDGRFPRYLDVIPSAFDSRYEIQRAVMLEQCETILLSTDEESRGVDFVFPASESDCNVRLKAKSETLGTANAIFHCETVDSTERHTITLDANFLAEYLKCSQAKFVTVNIQDSDTAILITADDGNGRYVQMPLSQDR